MGRQGHGGAEASEVGGHHFDRGPRPRRRAENHNVSPHILLARVMFIAAKHSHSVGQDNFGRTFAQSLSNGLMAGPSFLEGMLTLWLQQAYPGK